MVKCSHGPNIQVLADLARQVVIDLGVARNCGRLTRGAINVDRVVGSFAQQFAPMLLKVPTLHVPTFSGSRITSLPATAS